MLVLSDKIKREIVLHAELEYPDECCGILLGSRDGKKRTACRAVRTANLGGLDRSAHFAIDPLEIFRVELSSEKEGMEIIGFYHSHPDHEAVISSTDALYMIAGYSYPIVSVRNGSCVSIASFEKILKTSGSEEEPIITESEN